MIIQIVSYPHLNLVSFKTKSIVIWSNFHTLIWECFIIFQQVYDVELLLIETLNTWIYNQQYLSSYLATKILGASFDYRFGGWQTLTYVPHLAITASLEGFQEHRVDLKYDQAILYLNKFWFQSLYQVSSQGL